MEQVLIDKIVEDVCKYSDRYESTEESPIYVINGYRLYNKKDMMKDQYIVSLERYVEDLYGITHRFTMNKIISKVFKSKGW